VVAHPLRAGTLARAGTLPEETDSLTLEPGEVVTPTGDDAHPGRLAAAPVPTGVRVRETFRCRTWR
jgi:hypothetical protein